MWDGPCFWTLPTCHRSLPRRTSPRPESPRLTLESEGFSRALIVHSTTNPGSMQRSHFVTRSRFDAHRTAVRFGLYCLRLCPVLDLADDLLGTLSVSITQLLSAPLRRIDSRFHLAGRYSLPTMLTRAQSHSPRGKAFLTSIWSSPLPPYVMQFTDLAFNRRKLDFDSPV